MATANTVTSTAGTNPVDPADPAFNEKVAGPIKEPLSAPIPQYRPKPRPALTAEQQSKYDWLFSQAKAWTSVPGSAKGKAKADTAPLQDSEKEWLTRECLLRYLRASKWNQKNAEKRLLDTLAWRRDYGVDTLTAAYISPENETGKQLLLGYDKEARPCHYMNPARQNTDPSPRQVQHVVFILERVIDLMPPGQETLALLINFKSGKSGGNPAPGLGIAREVLNIMQNHYPERLGKALIVNAPRVIWGFFKLITPFIDPMTREKLKFNEDLKQYVPAEQLWTEYNGDLDFEYDHSVYWPSLQNLCSQRRAERHARWVSGGQQLGELEDFLSGLVDVGVSGATCMAEETKHDTTTEPELKDTAVEEITATTEVVNLGEPDAVLTRAGGEDTIEAAEHETVDADFKGVQVTEEERDERVGHQTSA